MAILNDAPNFIERDGEILPAYTPGDGNQPSYRTSELRVGLMPHDLDDVTDTTLTGAEAFAAMHEKLDRKPTTNQGNDVKHVGRSALDGATAKFVQGRKRVLG